MRSRTEPSGDTIVRAATAADLAAIVAIYNEGIRGRGATFETRERTVADITPWLEQATRPTIVIEEHSRVIGWARAGEYRAREAYAGIGDFSVYVAGDARGRRAGDRLLAALITECEQLGYWKLLSRIFPENAASRKLCMRHGFREVGVYERHGRLDGVWRDVVIVERLLGDAQSAS
ncbi:MAG: arsinothricin resistance N-acetyltransferase ArsN1 family A [bacterium]